MLSKFNIIVVLVVYTAIGVGVVFSSINGIKENKEYSNNIQTATYLNIDDYSLLSEESQKFIEEIHTDFAFIDIPDYHVLEKFYTVSDKVKYEISSPEEKARIKLKKIMESKWFPVFETIILFIMGLALIISIFYYIKIMKD